MGGSRRVWVEVFGIIKRARRLEALPGHPALQMGGGGGDVEIEKRRPLRDKQECLRYL